MTANLVVDIVGRDLPGLTFGEHGNVHVGIQLGKEVVEVFRGDAPRATWTVELEVVLGAQPDFKGTAVQGKKGDRFIYLSWGDVAAGAEFAMFRRIKLMLAAVEPRLIEEAIKPRNRLVGSLGLTDERGGPLCSSIRPPVIEWSVKAS